MFNFVFFFIGGGCNFCRAICDWDERDDENDSDVFSAKLLCKENPLEVSKGMAKFKEYSVTIVDKGNC